MSGQYHHTEEMVDEADVRKAEAPAKADVKPASTEKPKELVREEPVDKEASEPESEEEVRERHHHRHDGRQHEEEYMAHRRAYKAWKHERKQ